MTDHEVGLNATVKISIGDESAVARCVDNHDDQGQPQPDVRGGSGWRNTYYALRTREDVLEHFASNAVRNGVEDASRLDGWADLDPGVVTMRVDTVDLDWSS